MKLYLGGRLWAYCCWMVKATPLATMPTSMPASGGSFKPLANWLNSAVKVADEISGADVGNSLDKR